MSMKGINMPSSVRSSGLGDTKISPHVQAF